MPRRRSITVEESLGATCLDCGYAFQPPWLAGVARDVMSRPFEKAPPAVRAPRGLYYVSYTRRCPHGVKIVVGGRGAYYRDTGPGFVYFAQPAECHRFKTGLPLGGGWYASD